MKIPTLVFTITLSLAAILPVAAADKPLAPVISAKDAWERDHPGVAPEANPYFYPNSEQEKAMLKPNLDNEKNVAAVVAAMPDKLTAVPKRKAKLFVYMGGQNPAAHKGGAAGFLILLREAARKYGAFELTECYDPNEIQEDTLKSYDAVIANNCIAGGKFGEYLVAYVKNGGGVFANHGTGHSAAVTGPLLNLASYGYSHWNGQPFPLKMVEPNNPLLAGLRYPVTPRKVMFGYPGPDGKKTFKEREVQVPKEFLTELNLATFNKEDAGYPVRVLLTLDDDHLPADWAELKEKFPHTPFIWIREYGKGRIYYTQFAHDIEPFKEPSVSRSILDGIQYVLGDLSAGEAPTKTQNEK